MNGWRSRHGFKGAINTTQAKGSSAPVARPFRMIPPLRNVTTAKSLAGRGEGPRHELGGGVKPGIRTYRHAASPFGDSEAFHDCQDREEQTFYPKERAHGRTAVARERNLR